METVGILATQGGFHAHQRMLASLGHQTLLVKNTEDLNKISRLIIPGGESTTLILLLKKHGIWNKLKTFCQTNPVMGTCAGCILLAHNIRPNGDSFNIIDMTVNRNGYGRQLDSFETTIELNHPSKPKDQSKSLPAIFIRAPIIENIEPTVEILASYQNTPILVQQNKSLACTFHPELTDNTTIHEYFMQL